jgi:hypothetical protein
MHQTNPFLPLGRPKTGHPTALEPLIRLSERKQQDVCHPVSHPVDTDHAPRADFSVTGRTSIRLFLLETDDFAATARPVFRAALSVK